MATFRIAVLVVPVSYLFILFPCMELFVWLMQSLVLCLFQRDVKIVSSTLPVNPKVLSTVTFLRFAFSLFMKTKDWHLLKMNKVERSCYLEFLTASAGYVISMTIPLCEKGLSWKILRKIIVVVGNMCLVLVRNQHFASVKHHGMLLPCRKSKHPKSLHVLWPRLVVEL